MGIPMSILLNRYRSIASVALRSIHTAGETLTDRREQDEVFATIKQITENTGWNVRFMFEELPQKWGWNKTPSPQQQHSVHPPPMQNSNQPMQTTNTTTIVSYPQNQGLLQPNAQPQAPPAPKPPSRPRLPTGIVNPMYAHADFSQPEHPYGTHYVPPNPMIAPVNYSFSTVGFGNSLG